MPRYLPDRIPGTASLLQQACKRSLRSRRAHFLFALWAAQREQPPTIKEIQALSGTNYETARQWRNDWLEARSIIAR